jgi:hypothetical protein
MHVKVMAAVGGQFLFAFLRLCELLPSDTAVRGSIDAVAFSFDGAFSAAAAGIYERRFSDGNAEMAPCAWCATALKACID